MFYLSSALTGRALISLRSSNSSFEVKFNIPKGFESEGNGKES